jgi:hypothetical protein
LAPGIFLICDRRDRIQRGERIGGLNQTTQINLLRSFANCLQFRDELALPTVKHWAGWRQPGYSWLRFRQSIESSELLRGDFASREQIFKEMVRLLKQARKAARGGAPFRRFHNSRRVSRVSKCQAC